MAEEITTSPEESVSMDAPIVESPVNVQEEVVDVNPTPPTNAKGVENFKKLHGILAADEVYSQIVPSDFKQFLSKYSDVTKLQKLHGILAADEVYGQIMPADIKVAADKYGFGGLGKPSAVPSPSASGGSATKERGVLPVSMYSSTVDGYASPEELERTEREKAVLPSEQTISVKREDVKQKANMPSAKVIEETTPEMLAEGQQRIIKREAERALFENKAKQGNFLGMLQNSLIEGFTSTVNNTADLTLYLMSLGGIGVSPEYDAASNQEKARIFSEALDDVGIKKTLDKQLKTASTTQEYTQKRTEEGGPIMEGVVGLAGSAFPMFTPQQSGFFISGFVDSKKEIQEAMPELSPWKQAAYAFTQGAVQVALERAGLSNLIQNKSITRALSGKVMDAMKTTFGKFTAKEADVFATKVVNAFFAEAETGATQYAVQEGLRQLADALEGEDDKFEFEGGEEFILNIMKSGVSEGVGGVIMKSMAELPSLIKSPLRKKEAAAVNAQTEQLAADIQNPNVSPEAKVAIDKQINDNAEDVAKAYAEDLNKYEALTEESRADLNRINEDIISHEAVLNDPNVSPETKAISEQRIQELEEQGEGILDSAPAPPSEAPQAPTTTSENQVSIENRSRKDLFPDESEFADVIGGSGQSSKISSYREVNGIGISEYTNPENGLVDVIMTGTSNNDYVGYVRIYENSIPTNRWTSKMENKSGNKANFKTMINEVKRSLPEGHEYTEKTNISLDGLRVFANNLQKGYEYLRDKAGDIVTNNVELNNATLEKLRGAKTEDEVGELYERKTGITREEFNKIKESVESILPNTRLIFNETNGSVIVRLPVLVSTSTTEQAPTTEQAAAPQTLPEVTNVIATLRDMEQAEYADMSDPNDEAKRKQIYDRYDEIITPLLEKAKAEIEARRKEALDKYNSGDITVAGVKAINAKYDAKIEALNKPKSEAQASIAEEAKGEKKEETTLPPEIDSLDDNEIVSIKYETFDEIPESLKSKANKFGGREVKYRKSILGIPVGKEFTSKTKEGYVVTALGSEIKDAARQTLITQTEAKAPTENKQKIEIPKYFTFKELGGAKGKSGKALSSVEADKNEEIAQQLKDTLKDGDKLTEPNGTVTYFRDGKVVKEDGSPYGMVDIPAFVNGVTIERGEAQAPQPFPAQEGATAEQEQEFKANPELEQVYRDLNTAVTKNVDKDTIRMLKENPTEAMVDKALRELERKGVIKIDCN